jgi:Fe-S-cluster containining protein
VDNSSSGDMSCKRCGTCCRKGGPALHSEDEKLFLEGYIRQDILVTIRKGEYAFSPLTGRLERVQTELVKIAGKGRSWVCCLYTEQESSCGIYDRRPLECRLLKCWDTAELLPVIGKGTLTRADVVGTDSPMMKYIVTMEREISLDHVENLISAMQQSDRHEPYLSQLSTLARHDLALRSRAVSEYRLSLGDELFLFGRPLFKILSSRGVRIPMTG